MYIAGRLRTASNPSSTVICDSSYASPLLGARSWGVLPLDALLLDALLLDALLLDALLLDALLLDAAVGCCWMRCCWMRCRWMRYCPAPCRPRPVPVRGLRLGCRPP
jgi:hypothetical protein